MYSKYSDLYKTLRLHYPKNDFKYRRVRYVRSVRKKETKSYEYIIIPPMYVPHRLRTTCVPNIIYYTLHTRRINRPTHKKKI